MKKSLADRIEEYIRVLIARSEEKQIEIQRAELAETFCCVPSQVTYVISTRFTERTGFITESRRGGKGFIRISCCNYYDDASLISREELFLFIDHLLLTHSINEKESAMLKYLIDCSSKEISPEQKSHFFEAFRYALADFVK